METYPSPSEQMITSPKSYEAFVPHSFPPKLEWDNALVHRLSRASYWLGKLAQEGSQLPNRPLLMRPFIAREAVLSSKMEGAHTPLEAILVANAGAFLIPPSEGLPEVQNYIKALDYGLERLELPLSLRLIKEIHAQLMQGVRNFHASPGEFRRTQNGIRSPGWPLNTATFAPPLPGEIIDCLSEFENFLDDRSFPPLIHIALCHYQFEAIHPFLEGNGRMGRLLVMLLLVKQKMLPAPLLSLSAFFEATREEYCKQLSYVSSKGTWREWLLYFLKGIAVQSEDALSRAQRINEWLRQWKFAHSRSRVPEKMVQRLAENPYFTTNKMAQDLNVAYTTAQRGLRKLEAVGVIKKINNNKRDKLYCAPEILSILEEPIKIKADIYE